MNFISRLRNLFQRKYYMPAISVVFFSLMVYAFVEYIRNFEPLELPHNRKWSEIVLSDTLHVITIPTSFSAFEYKDKWYGYEYDIAKRVADSLGLELQMHIASSEQEIIDSLFSGGADVSIWPISQSIFNQYWYLRPTGHFWDDSQVVATMRKLKPVAADDTLTHYRISLPADTRQWQVFHDDSVRLAYDFSHFVIDTIPQDSLTNEELIEDLKLYKTIYEIAYATKKDEYGNPIPERIPFEQMLRHWMDNAKKFDPAVQKEYEATKKYRAEHALNSYPVDPSEGKIWEVRHFFYRDGD